MVNPSKVVPLELRDVQANMNQEEKSSDMGGIGGTMKKTTSMQSLAAEGAVVPYFTGLSENQDTEITKAAFTSDGNMFVTASKGGEVFVYSAAPADNGVLKHKFFEHKNSIWCMGVHPFSNVVVTGDVKGNVCAFDIRLGKVLMKEKVHERWVKSVSFSPDGKVFATCSNDCTFKVFSTDSFELLLSSDAADLSRNAPSAIWVMDFSPNMRFFACGRVNNVVDVYQINKRDDGKFRLTFVHRLEGHNFAISAVLFSPDSSRLVSGSQDGAIRIWDCQKWGEHVSCQRYECDVNMKRVFVNDCIFSPDGTKVFVAAIGEVVCWDVQTGAVLFRISKANFYNKISLSPDGRFLYASSYPSRLEVYDAASGCLKQVLLGGKFLSAFASTKSFLNAFQKTILSAAVMSPTGNQALVVHKNGAGLFDVRNSGSHLHYSLDVRGDYHIRYTVQDPTGTIMAHVSTDHTVTLRDIGSGEVISRLTGLSDTPSCVIFLRHQRRVVTFDSCICVFDIDTGECMKELLCPTVVRYCDISKDDERVVFSGNDGTVHIATLSNMEIIESFKVQKIGRINRPMKNNNVRYLQFESNGRDVWRFDEKRIYRWDHKTKSSTSFNVEPQFLIREWMLIPSKDADTPDDCVAVATVKRLHWTQEALDDLKDKQDAENEDGNFLADPPPEYFVHQFIFRGGKDTVFKHNQLGPHNEPVVYGQFSTCYGYVLSKAGNWIHVWRSDDAKLSRRVEYNTDALNKMRMVNVTEDGQSVVCADNQYCLYVYLAHHPPTDPVIVPGHTNIVNDILFSCNGNQLLTSSEDSIKCWSLQAFRYRPRVIDAWMIFVHPQASSTLTEMIDTLLSSPECLGLLNEQDEEGNTLLHYACTLRMPQIVDKLLSTVAFTGFLLNNKGETALDICLRTRAKSCMSVLVKHIPGKVTLWNMEAVSKALPYMCRKYGDLVLALFESLPLEPAHPRVQDQQPKMPSGYANRPIRRGCEFMEMEGFWKKQLDNEPVELQSGLYQKFNQGDTHRDPVALMEEEQDEVEMKEELMSMKQMWGASKLHNQAGARIGATANALVVPIPDLASFYKGSRQDRLLGQSHNPVQVIQESQIAPIMGTDIMRHVINFKWEMFGRYYFVRQFMLYLIFMALFITMTLVDLDVPVYRETVEGCVAAFSAYYLYFELRQLYYSGFKYLYDVWNIFEICGYLLAFMSCAVRFSQRGVREKRAMDAVAAILLYMRILAFLRGFLATGPFIRIIVKIVSAVKYFVLVLLIIVIAFSHAFYLLYRDIGAASKADGSYDENFEGWSIMLSMYDMAFGNWDINVFGLAADPYVGRALFVLYSVFVPLIILNLLIAFMSDIYADIQANVENEWLLERTKIILDIEPFLPPRITKDKRYFPKWLHILSPIQTGLDAPAEEVDVAASMADLEERVTEKLSSHTEEIQNNIQDLKKQMTTLIVQIEASNRKKRS